LKHLCFLIRIYFVYEQFKINLIFLSRCCRFLFLIFRTGNLDSKNSLQYTKNTPSDRQLGEMRIFKLLFQYYVFTFFFFLCVYFRTISFFTSRLCLTEYFEVFRNFLHQRNIDWQTLTIQNYFCWNETMNFEATGLI